MFDIGILLKRAGKVAAENTPAILTAIGVTGTLSTALLAARAGYQTPNKLREAEEIKQENFLNEAIEEVADGEEAEGVRHISPEPLTKQEIFEATWKLYAPALVSAGVTVTAIIFANRIQDRRSAALASAYTVVKESYSEYRAKNLEKIGKKKEQELRDEIAQDRRDRHPINKTVMVHTGRGPTLCYDKWNDRYFDSSKNEIDAAVNKFNQTVINDNYASQTDFYRLLGVPGTGHSDYIGWSTDELLEVNVSGTLDDESTPCLLLEFRTLPRQGFDQFA